MRQLLSSSRLDSAGSKQSSREQNTFNLLGASLQFPKLFYLVREILMRRRGWSIRLKRRMIVSAVRGSDKTSERTVTTSARQISSKGAQKKFESMLHLRFLRSVKESVRVESFLCMDTYRDLVRVTALLRLNCRVMLLCSCSTTKDGRPPKWRAKRRSALISASRAEGERERKFLSLIRRQQGMQQSFLSRCRSMRTSLVQPKFKSWAINHYKPPQVRPTKSLHFPLVASRPLFTDEQYPAEHFQPATQLLLPGQIMSNN